MNDGDQVAKRAAIAAAGKIAKGPAGYREVGVGTISLYAADGDLLRVVRIGRMPEHKKETLKQILDQELSFVLKQRPTLKLVKIADGAKDNWEFLASALPSGTEVLDFYHAAEHLAAAFGAAYGDGTIEARRHFEAKLHFLRNEIGGVDTVIRALAYQARKHPRRKAISSALGYFQTNRERMQYAEVARLNLPIGAGMSRLRARHSSHRDSSSAACAGEKSADRPSSTCAAGIKATASTALGRSSPQSTWPR